MSKTRLLGCAITAHSAAVLSASSALGSVPAGAQSNSWYGHDANDHQAIVGKALKIPPQLRLLIVADSTFRLYGQEEDGSSNKNTARQASL